MKIWLAISLLVGAACVGLQASPLQHGNLFQSQLNSQQNDGGSDEASPGQGYGVPSSSHVFLIIEENHGFSTVYPKGMPWLSSLGNAYGIATDYFSDQPGSLLDYFWLSSGSGEEQFGCAGWGCTDTITDDNIFRQLNRNRMSWKLYAESIPYAGYMGSQSGEYAKDHNPAAWYSDIVNSKAQQKKMVPFTDFAKDLAAKHLPNYSLIIPNLLHDAHNGTMAMADQWLKQNMTPLLRSAYFGAGSGAVMFITFDNGNGDNQGQVFTAVVGAHVIRGSKVHKLFHHENTLRTMMQLLGLKTYPGASNEVEPMSEFFK